MITVEQKPLGLTPVNVEHSYTFSSTLSGQTDFRYVIDVYVDTLTTSPTKVSRLFLAPNSFGKGIVDVKDIVKNYVTPNARSAQEQYIWSGASQTNVYGIISNVSGITNSNAFTNDGAFSPTNLVMENYPEQYHVRDYRLMVGEQYLSGGTTILDISTSATSISSVMTTTLTTVTTSYGGSPNTINWFGAGAYVPYGSLLSQGVNIYHRTFGGSLVYSANTSTIDGSYTPSSSPIADDLVDITERATGIVYRYQWFNEFPGLVGFGLIGVDYPAGYDYSPPPVYIWPGTSLNEGSYIPGALSSNGYWTDTLPLSSTQFQEVKKYRLNSLTIDNENPSMFLTTAGPTLYSFSDNVLGNVVRARRRKHHPACPILVSYFNGYLSGDIDFTFINNLEAVYVVEGNNQKSDYTTSTEYSNLPSYTSMTPHYSVIKYCNINRPDLAGGKVAIWAGNAGELGQWDIGGYSEVMEYYLQEDDCLSDPVHVLFLNRQGVWDTYTLDRRALETKNIERDMYSKGGIQDLPYKTTLSTDRRKTIYNQEITESMTVNTWLLNDNDKPIIMDLFNSPDVYIIKDHNLEGITTLNEGYDRNPYLLPVVLNMDSITEYKNQYNKQVQYEFVLEYTPINKYYTQG